VQCNHFETGFVLVSDVINVDGRTYGTLHALENAVLKKALGHKCTEHLKIFLSLPNG
jgi:hypothetical protein